MSGSSNEAITLLISHPRYNGRMSAQKKPERLKRLSLAPLSLEEALRGAMQVKPPTDEPKPARSTKPRGAKPTKDQK